jgi:excisionase family DNA binding protein
MDDAPTETAFLTIAEAAARVGLSYSKVRDAIQDGRLAAYRFGTTFRVRSEDLDRFVAAPTKTVFLTIAEAAARLSVRYGAIGKAIQAGRLAVYFIDTTYRVRSGDLDRFVAACRFAPKPPGSAPPGYRSLTTRSGLYCAPSRIPWVGPTVYVPAWCVARTARTQPSGDPSDG